MPDAPSPWNSRTRIGMLMRYRARAVWNRVQQAADEGPVRLAATVILVSLVWIGLYFLFGVVFHQFHRTPLEATVAIPLIFNFFFAAMLALLVFSNAILAYGALFGAGESVYLLTTPLTPRDFVTVKYLESLFHSSWSLVLIGLPLMLAMADEVRSPIFYVLFIAFFIVFIPIPGALGILLAWGAARFFPRRLLKTVAFVGSITLAVLVVWGIRSLRLGETAAEVWLRDFLATMSFVQSAFLPNQWVAAGIDHALHGQFHESGMYLFVTFANALFLSWMAVMIVSSWFDVAHDRALANRGGDPRRSNANRRSFVGLLFFYLPTPLRLIATKDMTTFLRDPLQWTQLAILFGLLTLYLTNLPTLWTGLAVSRWTQILPFLNLCAISLILATFTCRFVYPLVSLEGQKFWLVGLLPMPRGHLLRAKFAFAMTITLLGALGAMALAIAMLNLHPLWALLHVLVVVAVCYGLCGFSVGIGARLPMFDQPYTAAQGAIAARVANSVGGTTNLLASLALMAGMLTCVGVATLRTFELSDRSAPDPPSTIWCVLAAGLGVSAGQIALTMGAKHLERIDV